MAQCGGPSPGPGYAFGTLTGYDNHDVTKSRAPAYSLGLKVRSTKVGVTPGPYNVGNVDRHGKYPNLGWTMETRGAPPHKQIGPSPLTYAPEKITPYTPAYSLGLKLPPRNPPFGPSPAEYFPQYPPTTGYTIGSPFKNTTKFTSPGPKAAVPTDLYKTKAPAYSLGLKGKSLYGKGVGPGPKYYPNRMGNPHAYSFGLKHSSCSPPLITHDDN